MPRSIKNPKKIKKRNKASKKEEASSSVPSAPAKVWQPGVDEMEEGEELQFDPSAYNYLRGFNIGWPCLSFDVVQDSLGLVRTEFPHTLYGVAGTQADQQSSNYIGIFKLSEISGKKRNLVPATLNNDEEMEDEDSSSSDEEDDMVDAAGGNAPVLQIKKVAHQGCVNRIRSMTQRPHICATWGDTGFVQVWDFSSQLNSLAESDAPNNRDGAICKQTPLLKFGGHKDEGYAIDWSPVVPGQLVSGDCDKCIYLWEPTGDSWKVDSTPFMGHSASVEDLQWSPAEGNIFASSSVDGKIAIWDTREGKKPKIIFKAHDADVNVISWNRLVSWLIASGGDDGNIYVHDLRNIKDLRGNTRGAFFKYHKKPITSVEWSPHEGSTLAASSSDHQLTIWDLALERDEQEEAEFKAKVNDQVNAPEELPPQLLFVHQGQKDLKELHWHPQIPGMIVSTAADGFNVLMPSNIDAVLPSDKS